MDAYRLTTRLLFVSPTGFAQQSEFEQLGIGAPAQATTLARVQCYPWRHQSCLGLSPLTDSDMAAPVTFDLPPAPEDEAESVESAIPFVKQGPAGMTVAQWADLVTIEVGPHRNAFVIPRFLARETSSVFQRRFAQHRTRTIRLPDDDPWLFTMYAVYVYKSNLAAVDMGWEHWDEPEHWDTLARLWRLSMRLEDDYFRDRLSALLRGLVVWTAELYRGDFFPGVDDVELVFGNTPDDHFIRRAFAFFWAAYATPQRYRDVEADLHPEFRREMLRQKLRMRDARMNGRVLMEIA